MSCEVYHLVPSLYGTYKTEKQGGTSLVPAELLIGQETRYATRNKFAQIYRTEF